MRARLAILALAACGSDPFGGPQITASAPPHGPLVGGTRITLTGSGFYAASNRVLVGGREAPLAAAIDDERLELVTPPGERAGDAEVIVFNDTGSVRATGLFRYSAAPAITAVSPADVLFSSTDTVVTLTGSGFLDEGAGDVSVTIDGALAADVHVASDTSLSFVAPAGRVFVRPQIELTDVRGTAIRPRAFRYTPSLRGGLLLFTTYSWFALFLDPVDGAVTYIPWVGTAALRYTAVVRDDDGDYWGLDRNRLFGRINWRTQRIEAPVQIQAWVPTVIRMNGELLTYERNTRTFGTIDPQTGLFATVGAPSVGCCGSYGLAHDGATIYFASRTGSSILLYTIDRATGTAGPPITLTASPSLHIEEMRFFRGTLYVTSREGTLAKIDPLTGVTTVLPYVLPNVRANAMEIVE